METEKTSEKMDENTMDTSELEEVLSKKNFSTDDNYKHSYLWTNVIAHTLLQIGWVVGGYYAFAIAKGATLAWAVVFGFLVSQSVSLGAHRGYSHKSFKATLPLQFLLLFLQTASGQNSMFTWARDHRLHHKFSDTDGDPHNANRGFFFAHMGWLMVKKHPLVLQKQKLIDVSDLRQDKLVMFQHRYFVLVYIFAGMIVPIAVPMYFWNETFWNSFLVAYCFQYVTNLHVTWTVNSFGHLWGSRPYDKRIKAVESRVALTITLGDGSHNYHHAFPWDCRISEQGRLSGFGTALLEFLNYVGLAYDLKTASPQVVFGHMKRHGDGSGQESLHEKLEPAQAHESSMKNDMHSM